MKKNLTPLISVIIPAHNAEKSIEKAVSSVLGQTYKHLQIIIIDDGSSDSTPAIVKKLSLEFPLVQLIQNKTNKGVSASRNLGIEAAKGKWLTFLDADDYFHGDYISSVSSYLSKYNFICTSYTQSDGRNNTIIKQHGLAQTQEITDSFLLSYMEKYFFQPYKFTALVHCWNKFYERELIVKNDILFNQKFHQLEDVNFVCRYLYYSKKKIFLNSAGIIHVVSKLGDNLSRYSGYETDASEKLVQALLAAKKLKDYLLANSGKEESVCFHHLVCSMSILFCMRLGRQFWQSPSLLLVKKINTFLASKPVRSMSSSLLNVPGESQLLAISMRHFPTIFSTAIILLIRR